MFDLTRLLVATAYAQDAQSASASVSAPPPSVIPQFLMFGAVFAVFYFLLIRPQQKKLDDQSKMIKALTRGDRVITGGGIHGKIVKLEGDDLLIVEIADGVQVKVVRNTVTGLAAKTEPLATPKPANSDAPAAKADKKA